MKIGATKPHRNWRLEESKKFTVAPAYNKGAYQVITRDNVKDIGKWEIQWDLLYIQHYY